MSETLAVGRLFSQLRLRRDGSHSEQHSDNEKTLQNMSVSVSSRECAKHINVLVKFMQTFASAREMYPALMRELAISFDKHYRFDEDYYASLFEMRGHATYRQMRLGEDWFCGGCVEYVVFALAHDKELGERLLSYGRRERPKKGLHGDR